MIPLAAGDDSTLGHMPTWLSVTVGLAILAVAAYCVLVVVRWHKQG